MECNSPPCALHSFPTRRSSDLTYTDADGAHEIDNDWVLALTGYRPNYEFLENMGIEFGGERLTPSFNAESHETNRRGVYLAGTVCGGLDTSRWFIENGRDRKSVV